MNQKQINKEFDKAENEFREVIGACYVFLRHNSDKSESEIIEALQYGVAKVIEYIKKEEARLN
ncbi:MAG TPA: hypothetical protein VLE02_06670 [Nitrosarchaeum sp.]|nr:hypothetical protein [Nitrosarchaeum sp.]